MKTGRFSFLFLLGVVFSCTAVTAQQQAVKLQDSSQFYYRSVTELSNYSTLPAAISYIDKVHQSRLKIGDTLNAVVDLWYVAAGQLALDFYVESENTAVEAFNLLQNYSKTEEASRYQLSLYNLMGRIFRAREDYQAAIEFYTAALENDHASEVKLILYNNLGNVYKDLDELEKARKFYNQACEWGKKSADTLNMARVLDNKGTILLKQKQDTALHYFKQALLLRKQKKSTVGTKSSYYSLAKYYSSRDREKAIAYADSMKTLAASLGAEDRLEALRLQLDLGVLSYGKEFQQLSDSLQKARKLATNKYAYRLYSLEEEHRKGEALQRSNEKFKNQIILLSLVLIFMAIIAGLVYIIILYRNKRKRIRLVFETESRISKKVHDEVANDLYHLMTKVESGKQELPATVDELERIYERTRDISRELSDLDYKNNFELLLLELLEGYTSENVQVITRNLSGIKWDTLSKERKATLYRALQELMTNMKKHSKASLVAVSFQQQGKRIGVQYSDNGQGSEILLKGGLLNTENRMDAIGGAISFESEPGKGFRATITI
ncbi:MAG: hypothetical protein DWP94_04055 [Flavobacterium sp.]|nr:MAG: hypothetical protein DWP94_04055 [Flavobacterium sp.]